MEEYPVVVERDPESGLYVGYVPGFPGAHSQGETEEELHENLREVIEMLLEESPPTGPELCLTRRPLRRHPEGDHAILQVR